MNPCTEYGALNPAWLESLKPDQLRAWLASHLQGRDLLVPDHPDALDMPHYVIMVTFPDLDRELRRDIKRALVMFLEELQGGAPEWQGEAGESLLLLIQSLIDGADPAFIAPLEAIARAKTLATPEAPVDLHHRVLQTFVSLNGTADEAFWQEQLSIAPAHYGPITFQGQARTSLAAAFALMRSMTWNAETEEDLRLVLEDLVHEGHYPHDVKVLLSEYLPTLPTPAQSLLREVYHLGHHSLDKVDHLHETARQEAERILLEADQRAKAMIVQSTVAMEQSNVQAKLIRDEAKNHAMTLHRNLLIEIENSRTEAERYAHETRIEAEKYALDLRRDSELYAQEVLMEVEEVLANMVSGFEQKVMGFRAQAQRGRQLLQRSLSAQDTASKVQAGKRP